MMIRTVLLSAVSLSLALATAGCAHGGAAQRPLESHGQVVGTISLPEGAPASACSSVAVSAKDAAGQTYGDIYVRQSRNRCSYEVLNLPTEQPLTIQVSPGAAACVGTEAQPKGDATVTLARNVTKLVDFAVTCGANSGSAAGK